VIGVDWRSE